jgi:hypothetical protein
MGISLAGSPECMIIEFPINPPPSRILTSTNPSVFGNSIKSIVIVIYEKCQVEGTQTGKSNLECRCWEFMLSARPSVKGGEKSADRRGVLGQDRPAPTGVSLEPRTAQVRNGRGIVVAHITKDETRSSIQTISQDCIRIFIIRTSVQHYPATTS